jgi:hypothetical protein
MNRSRTALAIAAGLVATVSVVAVAAVAATSGRTPSHRQTVSAGDDLELQALSQVEGSTPSPSASSSGRPGGPGFRGPRGGLGGLGGGLLGGGILHGTVVVQGPDGKPVTVAIQRGTVTSVGGGKLVVHSSDGFDQTWTTASTTHFVMPGLALGMFKRGDASAAPSGSRSPSAQSLAKGATVLVLGRTQGSGTPAARLVLTVPTGAGLGFGRAGHGFGPQGGVHPRLPGPPWHGSFSGPKPSGSPSPAI